MEKSNKGGIIIYWEAISTFEKENLKEETCYAY